jgi:hypothetical protein
MWLAGKLGKSDRAIRRSLKRLKGRELLASSQQGWNRTNCYVFMMDGKPLIPGAKGVPTKQDDRTSVSACDRTSVSACDRTSVSAYLLESDPLESDSLGSASSTPSKRPREKQTADERRTQVGVIIDRVVRKLGQGNDEIGWAIYRQFSDQVRIDLRKREREGTLNDETIESFLQGGSA